jgi:tetratricopeptide (TPR) repeat protein
MKILDAKAQVEYIPQFLDYLNGRAPAETMINFYYQAGYELLTKTKHEYPSAIVILKLGEKIAPNDPRILFGLGKALYLGGDQVQGTDYLSKAYQIDPSLRDLK